MSDERQHFELTIGGMHCGACVRRVTVALQRLPGVTVSSVEVGRASGDLEGDETSRADLVEAVKGLGFSVEAEGG